MKGKWFDRYTASVHVYTSPPTPLMVDAAGDGICIAVKHLASFNQTYVMV